MQISTQTIIHLMVITITLEATIPMQTKHVAFV
jgi:hypothetical protein